MDRDGVFYGLDKNGSYAIAIASVIDYTRGIVRYGVNQSGYPKFVAMMFAAYIDGQYYSLKGDIPAFNGFAELAPASSTAGVAPMRYSCAKWPILVSQPSFRLGEQIESGAFNR